MASTWLLANAEAGFSSKCLSIQINNCNRDQVGSIVRKRQIAAEGFGFSARASTFIQSSSQGHRLRSLPHGLGVETGRKFGTSFASQSCRCRLPQISCSGTTRLECERGKWEYGSFSRSGLVGRTCRLQSKRDHHTRAKASKEQWTLDQSPYETLGVQGDVSEEGIKTAYRNLVKIYHPDVYQGTEDGEPAGARFIRIQAAYELLMDREARGNYDRDHKRNPFMASEAWQAYVARKKKAFEQRGDVAATAWAEVQRHEMQVKARQMAKQKMDPEEERRLVAKEVQLKAELFDRTSKRHMLVLKKRDLAKRRAGEDEKKLLVQKLLLEEGFELADED